ncbi:unnamed protein product [Dracunculus medinensis]|uniref:Cytochrome c oxidase assembly factor 5 n=1 Tax=Dracunculus medinensis TaxID=318479 RepID=A0A0N4UKB8_DRAME|nr:unnamed protein product [Dracunculus medinensis]
MFTPTRVQQQYEDSAVAEQPSTGRSCDRLRKEVKRCIKESDCVQKARRPAKECVQARDGSVPTRCYKLLSLLSDCKRSMIDMRARFRGRKGDL